MLYTRIGVINLSAATNKFAVSCATSKHGNAPKLQKKKRSVATTTKTATTTKSVTAIYFTIATAKLLFSNFYFTKFLAAAAFSYKGCVGSVIAAAC